MMSSSLPGSKRPSYTDLRQLKKDRISRNSSSNSLSSMLTYLDESPKNRRTINNSLPSSEESYSERSLLRSMERFVKSVNNMDATVLVPSRLKDLSGDDDSDLYSFFNTLNEEKNELLWGPDTDALTTTISRCNSYNSLEGNLHGKLSRVPSSGSLGSFDSTSNDSDSEDSNGNADLNETFRYHLQGLNTIFHQLADTADHLTEKYQEATEL